VVAPDLERLRVGERLLEAGRELVHAHGRDLRMRAGLAGDSVEMRP
jgi:hypothetical protein